MSFDSENARMVDRIRATAFLEAREAGAKFITKKWVSDRLKRSEDWVKDNWRKNPLECFTDFSKCGRPEILSQESKDIVYASTGLQRKSCRELSKQILLRREKNRSHCTVYRFLRKQGFKPFHVISKPLKTNLNRENRLFLAEFAKDYDETDFLHFAFSDEFFIYSIRKPNHQNDRVWALEPGEIEDGEHFRGVVKYPSCIGIFLMFTAKRLLWVIKDQGQSWDGNYFRQTVLGQNVLPFLSDPDNVLIVGETTFVHDRAPCMKANSTQKYLEDNHIEFWGNNLWPGNSPDLNPTENLGEILKDKVEALMHQEAGPGRYSQENLRKNLNSALLDLEYDENLFQNLLCSMPERLRQVRDSHGGETDF